MPIERLLDVLGAWRSAPADAEPLELRRFPVHDGGCLALRVPCDWAEEIALEGSVSTVTFRPPLPRGELRIAVHALSAHDLEAFSVEEMRRAVTQAARDAPRTRVESLRGRFGGGFYCMAPEALMQGRYLVRPVLLEFTIAASSAPLRRTALDCVRSARPSSA